MLKVALSLGRSIVVPGFREVKGAGTLKAMARICRHLTEGAGLGERVCNSLNVVKRMRRVKLEELDPNRYGLASPEHPIQLVQEYGFGLISRRIVALAYLRKGEGANHLLHGWRELAMAMKHGIEDDSLWEGLDRCEGRGISTSNLYSEVYLLEGSVKEVEAVAPGLTSPLKTRPSELTPVRGRDPMAVSRDGLIVKIEGQGRALRDVRRKVRRTIRTAVDLVLGAKVFYTNPKLWSVEEESWSALAGLIFFNPRFWTLRHLHPNRKLYAMYRKVLLPFREEVEEGKESFTSGLKVHRAYKVADVYSILRTVYRLGLPVPELRTVQLSELEGLVLMMLLYKDFLDKTYHRKGAIKKIATLMCEEFGGGERCKRELRDKIESREDWRGLSIEEMELLLEARYSSSRGILRKRKVLERLENMGFVESQEVNRTGRGRKRVRIYFPIQREEVAFLKKYLVFRDT